MIHGHELSRGGNAGGRGQCRVEGNKGERMGENLEGIRSIIGRYKIDRGG